MIKVSICTLTEPLKSSSHLDPQVDNVGVHVKIN